MVAGWRHAVGKPWAARAGVHEPVMVRRLNTSSDIRPLSGQDQHTLPIYIIPVVHGMNAQEQVKFWSCPVTISAYKCMQCS